MKNIAKRHLLKAYLAGKITSQELDKYVNIHFPKAVMLNEGEIKPEDKEIIDISERIDFDLLQIVFEEIDTSDKK